MITETITDRVLRDVLNSDTLGPYCGPDAFINAKRWRFLEVALGFLEERGLLRDTAEVVEVVDLTDRSHAEIAAEYGQENADFLAPDATPAPLDPKDRHPEQLARVKGSPLDPSKVKAGDTVTVEVDFSNTDPKAGLVTVAGTVWADYGDNPHGPVLKVAAYAIDVGNVTLTKHQPAPEPEPEWKPGTVAEIEVDGDHTYRAIRNDGGQWDAENAWTYGDSEVTDVRPLVVIDPAVARKALEDNGWGEHAVNEALHKTGIEAS